MNADDTDTKVARYARGKRPEFYTDPAMDEAMSMIMVLASELSVIRDRLDTFESVMADKGVVEARDLEDYTPDENALARREAERQAMLQRLFFVANKRAQEQAGNDTAKRYADVLKETATDERS